MKFSIPEKVAGLILFILAVFCFWLAGCYMCQINRKIGVKDKIPFRKIVVGSTGEFPGRPMYRTKVPHGWLVTYGYEGVAFVPDPEHEWCGE